MLASLLRIHDTGAEQLARRIATDVIPVSGDDRSIAVMATAELLSHRPVDWEIIWPAMKRDVPFGVEVLRTTAFEHEFDSFVVHLGEHAIADICIWLSSRDWSAKSRTRKTEVW